MSNKSSDAVSGPYENPRLTRSNLRKSLDT